MNSGLLYAGIILVALAIPPFYALYSYRNSPTKVKKAVLIKFPGGKNCNEDKPLQ